MCDFFLEEWNGLSMPHREGLCWERSVQAWINPAVCAHFHSVCRKKDSHANKAVSLLCHEITVAVCDTVMVYFHEVVKVCICMVNSRHKIFCLKCIITTKILFYHDCILTPLG